ncbi:ribosome-associated translation inhibitor RaiA [Candidatus Chloroploca sp. M-50]|uniref:Ribosome hibernation promoting factor n=2 Tax=Candidatus Chloroploca TaxID=1579476 RepID=A0A2H3KXP0_9CHLR|nr:MULTISPECIES: ribosome-associated translation inhibitor RaiA [Candidatus Chloroploca]MBP1467145.1 ribosome-associated translation inhibitor RaiA [Candidatus Chloroploca mongolica]PDV98758.1 ribosomal subunit interface protein [Candidatus Chloroploca asiatica]
MELTVKSRSGKITERQHRHIEEKLSKLGRYMGAITSATVEVHTEQHRNAGEVSRVQVTLVGEHGVILRAEEEASDLYTAVDKVQQVLQRQIKRYKEKYWRRERTRQPSVFPSELEADILVAELDTDQDDVPPQHEVIRTKQLTLRPMFTDDAIEQMELLGHNFFVFHDADSQRLSVLYRRRDGNYGMIVPDPV